MRTRSMPFLEDNFDRVDDRPHHLCAAAAPSAGSIGTGSKEAAYAIEKDDADIQMKKMKNADEAGDDQGAEEGGMITQEGVVDVEASGAIKVSVPKGVGREKEGEKNDIDVQNDDEEDEVMAIEDIDTAMVGRDIFQGFEAGEKGDEKERPGEMAAWDWSSWMGGGRNGEGSGDSPVCVTEIDDDLKLQELDFFQPAKRGGEVGLDLSVGMIEFNVEEDGDNEDLKPLSLEDPLPLLEVTSEKEKELVALPFDLSPFAPACQEPSLQVPPMLLEHNAQSLKVRNKQQATSFDFAFDGVIDVSKSNDHMDVCRGLLDVAMTYDEVDACSGLCDLHRESSRVCMPPNEADKLEEMTCETPQATTRIAEAETTTTAARVLFPLIKESERPHESGATCSVLPAIGQLLLSPKESDGTILFHDGSAETACAILQKKATPSLAFVAGALAEHRFRQACATVATGILRERIAGVGVGGSKRVAGNDAKDSSAKDTTTPLVDWAILSPEDKSTTDSPEPELPLLFPPLLETQSSLVLYHSAMERGSDETPWATESTLTMPFSDLPNFATAPALPLTPQRAATDPPNFACEMRDSPFPSSPVGRKWEIAKAKAVKAKRPKNKMPILNMGGKVWKEKAMEYSERSGVPVSMHDGNRPAWLSAKLTLSLDEDVGTVATTVEEDTTRSSRSTLFRRSVRHSRPPHKTLLADSPPPKSGQGRMITKNVRDMKWESYLMKVKDFVKLHGHGCVPTKYPADSDLAAWACRQRCHYAKFVGKNRGISHMTAERAKALTNAGFCWDNQKWLWERKFDLFCKYVKEQGTAVVPSDKWTEVNYPGLLKWTVYQRDLFQDARSAGSRALLNQDNLERLKKLEALNFDWQEQHVEKRKVKKAYETISPDTAVKMVQNAVTLL